MVCYEKLVWRCEFWKCKIPTLLVILAVDGNLGDSVYGRCT